MNLKRFLAALCSLFVAAVLALALPSAAKADNEYASIRGTVTDASGGVVPDAAITVTNPDTGITQRAFTGKDGTFSILQVQIGDYTLKAEKAGFKTFATTKIHLEINQVYVADIKMDIGEFTQVVTVESNGVQVETSTPQLGSVIDSNQILNMPLLGRNWLQLQQLEPGVQSASDRFGTGTGGGNFSTNGAQSQMNSFLVDGTDSNDIVLNTQTFNVSPDAIQEFREVTSTVNPEYARATGSVVNAVTKSGTNSFHGDAFEFYRTPDLNGRNFFQQEKQIFHQNLFGGTIGGPVIKNHTFFFFSYQGNRFTAPQNAPSETPVYPSSPLTGTLVFPGLSTSAKLSPFALTGDNGTVFPAGTPYSTVFSNGTIPTADINPISNTLVTKFVPLPNTVANGVPSFQFSPSLAGTQDQYLVRIDQTFNAKDSIWGSYLQDSTPTTETIPFVGTGASLPGFGEIDSAHFKFLTLAWNHVINDHMLNELRGGWDRFNFGAVFPQNPALPSSVGFTGITPQITEGVGLPVINVAGLFDLGFTQDGPQPRIDQNFELADNFSVTHGRHTMKFGIDFRRWYVKNPFAAQNDGFYNFAGTGAYSTGVPGADFLLGIADSYSQGSGTRADERAQQYYSYAQDEFKIKSNLTLTYGLGWTVDTPMIDVAFDGHAQLAFRPGEQSTVFPNAPAGIVYGGDPGANPAGTTHFKDFGPRLGFAYSPNWDGPLGWLTGGAGKTSIRAGYGIYYSRSESEQGDQVLGMPPFAITSRGAGSLIVSPTLNGSPSFANPYADIAGNGSVPNPFPFAGPPANVQFTTAGGYLPIYTFCCASLDIGTRDPVLYNYNLTIQRQVNSTTVVTLGYVGSAGRHESVALPVNIATNTAPCSAEPLTCNASSQATIFPNDFKLPANIYGPIDTIFSIGNSNYNSFQASVNKHLSHGLQFTAAYTWAHSLDDASGFENSGFGGSNAGFGGFGSVRASNPYCFPRCDYASSAFDGRNRLVISYFYQIPGTHGSNWVSRATNGWTIAGITTFQGGFPLDVVNTADPSLGCQQNGEDFACWDVPNQVGAVKKLNPRTNGNAWFNASAFAPVVLAPGTPVNSAAAYGNASRNVVPGPGRNNWDFQLFKDTRINERMRVELRAEVYNIFNHTQFNPQFIITDINQGASFGQATAAYDARETQLAAKFYF
jgi:Carboxypeptidase regulatory-like domain